MMKFSARFEGRFPHVIVVGGGFAGLELVRQFKNQPFEVTLIDKQNFHTFQPLLYQLASGGIGPDGIAYPLRKIVGVIPNIRFRMAEVQSVDLVQKCVKTNVGTFPYDYLILATGAATHFFGNKAIEAQAFGLKSIQDALALRSSILLRFEKAINASSKDERLSHLHFVVVGGGPTGVETAGALIEMKQHVLPVDYRELDASEMKVTLIEASPRILAAMSPTSSERARLDLEQMGVEVKLGVAVQSYQSGVIRLSDGENLKAETLIWSAGVKGAFPEGLDASLVGKSNRLMVNRYLQLQSHHDVWVVGDVALVVGDEQYPNGHPMVAPVAVQQAKIAAFNIKSQANGKPLRAFKYRDNGSMATIGRHKAVMEAMGFKLSGILAWLGWMFLHLMLLVGFRNRLIVFINWMWNYFSYQRAIRLITRQDVFTGQNQKSAYQNENQ